MTGQSGSDQAMANRRMGKQFRQQQCMGQSEKNIQDGRSQPERDNYLRYCNLYCKYTTIFLEVPKTGHEFNVKTWGKIL
jgi:hypothetical protein